MNILLIGYCHLADGFLYASKSLEKYKKGPIFEFLSTNEYFDNFTTKEHGVIDGPSIIAGAKTDTII